MSDGCIDVRTMLLRRCVHAGLKEQNNNNKKQVAPAIYEQNIFRTVP